MAVQRFSPEGLLQPTPYHHVAVGSGTRLVYVAGQTASVPTCPAIAADNLAGQVAQTLRNTALALAGAGATFGDVVRMTYYVTSWTPDQIGSFMAGVESVAEEIGLPMPMPPASLIGVEYLFEPGVLVELEVTAVLD